jgi:hypothetical protein
MKVTIIDPKTEENYLAMDGLTVGTLFTINIPGENLIGLIVEGPVSKNVVWLNSSHVHTVAISESFHKHKIVTPIKTIELSTE